MKTITNSLVLQISNSEPIVHKEISESKIVDLVNKHSPSLAANIEMIHERLKVIEKEIMSSPDYLVEYFLLHHAKAQTDKLLNSDLDILKAKEHKTRVDEYHKYASIGSALLYRDTNFGGGSKFFTVTWPNFKWSPYCFNDKASSAKVWGANILFQDTWYRGRRLYLIGLPYFELNDFKKVDFNDKASSFVSIG
jgi:Beta/Gamma crystallin.